MLSVLKLKTIHNHNNNNNANKWKKNKKEATECLDCMKWENSVCGVFIRIEFMVSHNTQDIFQIEIRTS